MVYGVDQCRVCGVRIVPKGPDTAIEQEKANRKPLMPEKEWRRRGFLTSPTKMQIGPNPADGCCAKCGMIVIKADSRFGTRWVLFALLFVVLATFLVFVITFLPH